MKSFYQTAFGKIFHGNALDFMPTVQKGSVNLIMTSPPFGLVRKKEYGNVDADQYLDWFRPFALEFKRLLKDNGSLVIDIGGTWIAGQPTRSLYQYELLIMLCKEFGFHLAQEFFWWNPSKLPTPAEWVNIRRVRVKDAINCIWWLSPTPWPKASNRRVLIPYSESMKGLIKNGYKAKLRPSGHKISENFSIDNGASIPPNLIAIANTESNSTYLRLCTEKGLKPHPARYPSELPEYFIRMLTDQNDFVFDPFAGSCVTGEVAERLNRKWICCDTVKEYLETALFRFVSETRDKKKKTSCYHLQHPAALWDDSDVEEKLPQDGGQKRVSAKSKIKLHHDEVHNTLSSENKLMSKPLCQQFPLQF
ncbi:MAG TPA: site-specific DNA-methyltransferase [Gammaproteobacteria bacterium]|nr:site-specific DNA-methyltransferase [Gammaproteobacteria bacterium]